MSVEKEIPRVIHLGAISGNGRFAHGGNMISRETGQPFILRIDKELEKSRRIYFEGSHQGELWSKNTLLFSTEYHREEEVGKPIEEYDVFHINPSPEDYMFLRVCSVSIPNNLKTESMQKNKKPERQEMKKKYGVYTLQLAILERCLGEEGVRGIMEKYTQVCLTKGGSKSTFDSVDHEDVYTMYKSGKKIEVICELFKIPKTRIWESIAIGTEIHHSKT